MQISDSEFRFDFSDPPFFLNVLSFRSSVPMVQQKNSLKIHLL